MSSGLSRLRCRLRLGNSISLKGQPSSIPVADQLAAAFILAFVQAVGAGAVANETLINGGRI